MAFHVKDVAEFKKFTKPIKKRLLEADIGESATTMLLAQAKQIEKLSKLVNGHEASIRNLKASIMRLEMRE